MFEVFFFIAAAIITAAVLAVTLKKRSYSETTVILLIGALAAIIALAYPLYRAALRYDAATSGVLAVLYGFLSLTGEQDALALLEADLGGWVAAAYRALLSALFIASPLLATGFVFTLFGSFADKLAVLTLTGSKITVFSRLNEQTLEMACSLAGSGEKIVFCNREGRASDLSAETRSAIAALGAVCVATSELDLHLGGSGRTISFYETDADGDDGVLSAIKLYEKYKDSPHRLVNILLFARGAANETLLNSLYDEDDGRGGCAVRVRMIDRMKYDCYSLLESARSLSRRETARYPFSWWAAARAA